MNKKRIVFLCEFYRPHWTGIAQVSVTLAELYAKTRQVTVITTQLSSTQPKYSIENDVIVYRIPYLFKLSRTNYSPQTIIFFLKKIWNYDTVFIHSPHSNIIFLSVITKLFRKKLFIYQHGDLILPTQTGNRVVNTIIQKLYDVCTYLSYVLADNILTQTEDYAKNSRLMKWFMYKFTPYIFPLRPFNKKESKKIALVLDNLHRKYVLIGFAGRFVEEKGFDVLLNSIPLVLKKFPNVMFVFAGALNVSYENFYEKNKTLFENNKGYVTVLGLLNDSGLKSFYKRIDCFVIPSRSDCFPYTQIEAMSFGVPSVVTNIPGARVPVLKTKFGTIVKPNNVESLANGIEETLKNKKKIMRYSEKLLPFLNKYGHIKNL